MYDYREAVMEAVSDFVSDELDNYIETEGSFTRAIERMMDDANEMDSITGNASGSYFCNSNRAKECVTDNFPLLVEALETFCDLENLGKYIKNEEWETLDVIIRCYLLGECFSKIEDEIKGDFED